jgi:uncharacterized protein (DUF1800 family)
MVVLFLCWAGAEAHALDQNGNQQSDVWEWQYAATGLTAGADADLDGIDNAGESAAGTDPLDADSLPRMFGGPTNFWWPSITGKLYRVQSSTNVILGWTNVALFHGIDADLYTELPTSGQGEFRRVRVENQDADGDGLSDWEELRMGFEPGRTNSGRYDIPDLPRLTAALTNTNSVVSCSLIDGLMYERWPDRGAMALRRTGSLRPLTVNISLGGSATREVDYTTAPGNTVSFPLGAAEVWVEFQPVVDADDAESDETIVLTVLPGPGYTQTTLTNATAVLGNETAASLPNPKAAARFLIQAAFGPDQDSTNDVDLIPENVEELMAIGYDAWISNQFTRPIGFLQPFTEYALTNLSEFYIDAKSASWWNRAMGVTNLIPPWSGQLSDPLRQRLAFALSQIVVVSDRPETLAVEPVGMANYYDMVVTNAFENYRDILFDTTMHPCMGFYLSALMNRKADPTNNIFPDENYAREIMQLFSIGLWQLNQDGTRQLGTNGLSIPTYANSNITELARVFTGLSFGPETNDSFEYATHVWTAPMRAWDEYHDCEPKHLLNGVFLPTRTPSVPDTGAAALLDINAAIDGLFNHPNVAPFIGRQLIQRFVTSNPSTGYIARVSAAFNNNGGGVRGDLQAVIRAVLMDPEARDPAWINTPSFGKQREPFLRVVNFARAFNAAAACGFYQLDQFYMDHYEEPMKAPSVFNFFKPEYLPPGPLAQAGLFGPEFQIVNAGSAISAPNYYYKAIVDEDLHRWGSGNPDRAVRPNFAPELALVNDPDELVRRLDLVLTGGTLAPREFAIVRDAVTRVPIYLDAWENARVWLAVYLIVTSPEFCVLR